ncbi:MAG: hypothetical protein U0840_05400 [Gemmataceae bacterium]
MPSRVICFLIVVSWLGFNGWLFFHDLLPRLMPGQPPPYTIDLVEETRTRRPHIDWVVTYRDRRAFRTRTHVDHPEHDVFELQAEFKPYDAATPPIQGIQIERLNSSYRVNTSGDLLGLSVVIVGRPNLGDLLRNLTQEFTVGIEGVVERNAMTPHLRLEMGPRTIERDLPTVQIPAGASVLLPLHPVNRITGLAPGQQWTLRLFDPLLASLSLLQGNETELRTVRASVRREPELFTWGKRREVPCHVIDYVGDDFRGSTWVGTERGQVLRQDVLFDNQPLIMYRD